MASDEIVLQRSCGGSQIMNDTTYKDLSPIVSVQQVLSGCYLCGMPNNELSTSANTISITGRFDDIERKYLIDSRGLGEGHLGEGHHGSVMECVDRETGVRCAVKTIHKLDSEVVAGDIVREIELLRRMKHPNIVRLVDVYEDKELLHLVTDLCSGGELFEKITTRCASYSGNNDNGGVPCFSEGEAARLLHQILSAVSYMHKRGIVHRDIKPENILFEMKDEDSPIKIIDFGLARRHKRKDPPMESDVGTPRYMAPEVIRMKYRSSCDLWSVGVVAYILLCGYGPFDGDSDDEMEQNILNGTYSFPSEDWKGISPEAKDFIVRLLHVEPRKRMTAERGLNHPWILRHTSGDDPVMDGENAVEKVVVKKRSRFISRIARGTKRCCKRCFRYPRR